MVSLGLWCLSVLVLLRKPCQVCGPTVLDAILKVREALYILVVHDRRKVVEDAVVVLMVRDRREVGHGLAVVALVRGRTREPAVVAVACAVLRNAKLLP